MYSLKELHLYFQTIYLFCKQDSIVPQEYTFQHNQLAKRCTLDLCIYLALKECFILSICSNYSYLMIYLYYMSFVKTLCTTDFKKYEVFCFGRLKQFTNREHYRLIEILFKKLLYIRLNVC